MRITSVFVCAALFGACGDPEDDRGSPTPELAWTECGPLQSEGVEGECTRVAVPLDWTDLDGPPIEIFVKRFRADPPLRGQLWLLDGGPGATGAAFDHAALVSIFTQRGLDLYIPTHRGTGMSSALACPSAMHEASDLGENITLEEAAECFPELDAEWGASLRFFGAEQAAADLGFLIERSAEAGLDVSLWGGSYGSYWAQRYLELFPGQARAVVLESVLDRESALSDQLLDAEAAGERLLEHCAADSFCWERLGDPRRALTNALSVIEAGTCAPLGRFGLTSPEFKAVARTLVSGALGYDARGLLFALLYRINRCAEQDAELLTRFVSALGPIEAALSPDDTHLAFNNYLLYFNELRIDLWPEALDEEAMARAHEPLLFASAEEWRRVSAELGRWPALPRAAAIDADTGMPVLILQGDLDTDTPLAWAERAASRYRNSTLVRFASGGHGVSFEDPTGGCALGLFLAFIEAPQMPLVTSCAEDVRGVDFRVTEPQTRALSSDWLGTEDPWDVGL